MHRTHRTCLAVAALVTGLLAAPLLAQDGLPDAKKVFDHAIEAMGGKKAIDAIETMHLESTMSMGPMQLTGHAYWAKSGACIVKRTVPQMGEMVEGTDGDKIGWRKMPGMSYQLLGEKEAEGVADQGAMHVRLFHMKKRAKEEFKSYETTGKETFNGVECIKISVVTKEDEKGDLFFDARTGLPVGYELVSPDNPRESGTITFADWKEIEDVKFFTKVSMQAMGQQVGIQYSKIELNKVDEAVFAVPDEVTKLAAAPKKPEDPELANFTEAEKMQIKQMIGGLEAVQDPAMLEQAVTQLESSVGFVPPEQKKIFEYVLEKAKERLKELEGEGGGG